MESDVALYLMRPGLSDLACVDLATQLPLDVCISV